MSSSRLSNALDKEDGTKIHVTTTEVKKEEESVQDKREKALVEKLARLARVPATAIFGSVSLFLLSHCQLIGKSLEPGSSPLGLTDDAARSALERHGPNIFAAERPPSPIALLLTAIANPFNFILAALGVISIATGDKATFVVLMVMILASTGLRFVHLPKRSTTLKSKG
jgi:Mg2+-importing ATPase